MLSTVDKTEQAARTAALRALATQPRSVAQMRTRLAGRFGDDAADSVVQWLVAQGLLDDEEFAASWRRSREHRRPRSASLVRRELVQRGVDRGVAEAAVEGMDDEATALQVARTQVRRLASVDRGAFERRLGGYLARRGFGTGVVLRTVHRLWEEQSDSPQEPSGI